MRTSPSEIKNSDTNVGSVNLPSNHPSKNNILEIKSNKSCSSYGKNYVLKSDFCKSAKFAIHHKKEEHPWLSYYGDMSKELSSSKKSFTNNNTGNNYNYYDCSLFTKPVNPSYNSNTHGVFKNPKLREINVTAYEEEEDNEDESEQIIECEEDQSNFENEIQRATYHIQNQINSKKIYSAFNEPKKLNKNISTKSDFSNENLNNFMFFNFQSNHNFFFNQSGQRPSDFIPNNIYYNNLTNFQNPNYTGYSQHFPTQKSINQNYSSYSDEALAQLSSYIIKEQNGCRFIQEKVISDKNFANNILFPCITKDLPDLICDQFGNYLFQVLIGVLSKDNLDAMFNILLPYFYSSCISPHGTRVIQKLIEKIALSIPLLEKFNQALSTNLVDISKDPYGNHVVQKYLTVVFYPQNQFVYDIIIKNIIDITNSKHGCCVTQKSISEGNIEQKRKVLKALQEYLFDIITNQFGNFAIQYILTANNLGDCDKEIMDLTRLIGSNILYFGKQKYSANVLEKCFENSSSQIQSFFVNEIMKDETNVEDLLLDSYGNYVIQKSLLVLKNEKYIKMLKIIANNTNKIKKKNFGNKLIAKLLVSHKEFGNLIENNHTTKYNNSIYE